MNNLTFDRFVRISRSEHDAMREHSPALLKSLFSKYPHTQGIDGVRFYDVDIEKRKEVADALAKLEDDPG